MEGLDDILLEARWRWVRTGTYSGKGYNLFVDIDH